MPRPPLAALVTACAIILVVRSPAAAGQPGPDVHVERWLELPVGFATLEAETVTSASTTGARAVLSRVVDHVQSTRLDPSAPLDVLRVIAAAAAAACPSLQEGGDRRSYGEALTTGHCDCDDLVLTYLTVADVLDLPLSAVFLPSHILLVWDGAEAMTYWETTTAQVRSTQDVESHVPEGASGTYLRPQSRTEMLGHVLAVRAARRHAHGDRSGAAEDYNAAVRLNPTHVVALANRGRLRLVERRWATALLDFDRAVTLDPSFSTALYGRGMANLFSGQPASALADFNTVIDLEGGPSDAHHGRGLALSALGDNSGAVASFTAALEVPDPSPLALLSRAALYERVGNLARAGSDYASFVVIATGTPHAARIPEARHDLQRLEAARRERAAWEVAARGVLEQDVVHRP